MLTGAMRTAVELTVTHFHAVPDNDAAALGTAERQRMDRTFEAIEYVFFPSNHDIKRLVIFVSTDFTPGHFSSFLQ